MHKGTFAQTNVGYLEQSLPWDELVISPGCTLPHRMTAGMDSSDL